MASSSERPCGLGSSSESPLVLDVTKRGEVEETLRSIPAAVVADDQAPTKRMLARILKPYVGGGMFMAVTTLLRSWDISPLFQRDL